MYHYKKERFCETQKNRIVEPLIYISRDEINKFYTFIILDCLILIIINH